VFVRVFGETHPVRASIYGNLGQLEEAAQHLPAALAAYQQALAVLEATEGAASADASGARRDVARILAAQGKADEAIAEQTRALAILERLGDDGVPRLVSGLVELANLQLERPNGMPIGLATAERALGLAATRPADANPDEVATAKFAVARGLVGTGGDRARARRLFDEARAAITDERRATLDAWRAGPGAKLP
jgi:tetratricopeptide (TPR) repeat protein